MDKKALERKLREIHKATCLRVDEKYFEPLYEDITCWKSWNALHAIAEATSCDVECIFLIQECCQKATRNFLGDKC